MVKLRIQVRNGSMTGAFEMAGKTVKDAMENAKIVVARDYSGYRMTSINRI